MASRFFSFKFGALHVQPHRPDLVRAQAQALRQQMPPLHFILAINSALIAIGYYGRAPLLLAVLIPVGLGLFCLLRGLSFVNRPALDTFQTEALVRRLRMAPISTAILGLSFLAWSIALFPYGDDLMHLYLSFFMMSTTLASALCLMYVPSLAIMQTTIVVVPWIVFDIMTGNRILILVAVNTLVIYLAILYSLTAYFRTFEELVGTRSRLGAQNAEVARLQERNSKIEEQRRRERQQDLERIADAFSSQIQSVTQALGEVSRHNATQSHDVSACSESVLERLNEVRGAAEGSEQALAAAAEATNALGQSIMSIKLRTSHAAAISTTVEPRTASADQAMIKLRATISKIDNISTMIKTVAGQIDLIALNATIEAARAGVAGRSFAVVASEIKILAARTAHATDDIARHMAEVKTASDAANASVEAMKHGFLELRAISDDIADALAIQTEVTDDIRGHVGRAVDGASSMRLCLTDMSTSSTRTSSSARAMLGQSRVLSREADVLAQEVTNFIGFIRAA